MKKTLKIVTLLSLFIILICTIVLITQNKTSYALEDNHVITIKNETNKNTNEEFTFRIKAWKEEIKKVEHDLGGFYSCCLYGNLSGEGVSYGFYELLHLKNFDIYLHGGEVTYSSFKSNIMYEEITEKSYPFRFVGEDIYNVSINSNQKIALINETNIGPGYHDYENIDRFKYNDQFTNTVIYHTKDGWFFETPPINLIKTFHENVTVVEEQGTRKNLVSNVFAIIDGKEYPVYIYYSCGSNPCPYTVEDDSFYTILEESSTTYLNLTDEKFTKISDGEYSFKLKNNETIDISIPDAYTYEIEELTSDGWQLVSINNDSNSKKAEDTSSLNKTYIFKNKSTIEDSTSEESTNTTPIDNNKENKNTNIKNNTSKEIKNETKKSNNTPKTGIVNNISTIILVVGMITFIIGFTALYNQNFKLKEIK